MAHTSGVKGGIITGLGNFIAILMACLLVRNEKMTGRKLAGCILGFAGVVIINMAGGSMDMGFRLTGEAVSYTHLEKAGSKNSCHFGAVRITASGKSI